MKADVAIVGAGAAGSATAAMLAPQASVLLVDAVAEPVWRIGETLPGAARRILAAIGAWPRFAAAGHASAPLKVSRWGSGEPVSLDAFRDPDGAGWRIDRARFEADLRANAVARGATLLAPARVRSIARTGGGWRLMFDTGACASVRYVIDAGGRRSHLLRPVGQRRAQADRLVCVHQRVRASGMPDPSTYTEAVPDGWWYTADLANGWRIIAFHGDSDQPAAREVLRRGPLHAGLAIPGLANALGPVEEGSATRPAFCAAHSEARSAAGWGWLAAGDAAIALDPLSSQGLFNALVTGVEAAEAAAALLRGDGDATAGYARRMSSIWQAYVAHHRLFYAMETRWPDAPFWRRRRADRAPPPAAGTGSAPSLASRSADQPPRSEASPRRPLAAC